MTRLLIRLLRAIFPPQPSPAGHASGQVTAASSARPRQASPAPPPRRHRPLRRIPRWFRWAAVVVVAGLIFRRALAWLVLTALGGALHLIGVNVHLPGIRFGWPWQSVTAGTTTNAIVGPWVLQKIEGIDKPALGTENFNFLFTHKVTKNIGPWPCWYAATFYAVGHASATVDLNPGPAWWRPSAGHYMLTVTRKPAGGTPGRVSVSMALPAAQLPRSVHDITIDNTLSAPVDTQHSWTYPGLGCGALIKPQFAAPVLYSQAQGEAFQRATHDPAVTRPMIGAAETEATKIIRGNFIQPTLNALGYTLTTFSIRWIPAT